MADIHDYLGDLKIEKFGNFNLDNNSSNGIDQNMVIFFDVENNQNTNEYIKNQHVELQQRFKEVDKQFIYISDLDYPENIKDVLRFYFPQLFYFPHFNVNQLEFDFKMKNNIGKGVKKIIALFNEEQSNSHRQDYQNILDYIKYNGNIKSGLIFFDHTDYRNYDSQCNTYILECNDLIFKDTQDTFFENLISFFKIEKKRIQEYDYQICNPYNPYADLDDDIKERIREIQHQLIELKNSGQLLFVLPILKDILQSEIDEDIVNKDEVVMGSNMLIDKDYKITLPYFNGLEISLSHLTKAVYILFYNNPEGINIKELQKYKKDLLSLYSKISNQVDYDKIMQSIDDLVNPESKAIYTHISRIKAAFCKQMDFDYVKKFIISGSTFGSDLKYIPMRKLDSATFVPSEFKY